MKVVFAIKTLSHSVGGAEKMFSFLTGAMAKHGMDVHILTMDRPSDAPFFKIEDTIKRHFCPVANAAHKTRLQDYPKLLWNIRQEVNAIKPDMVIAFMHSMFVPLQCALIGTGIKVVLSEHTAPLYYKTRKFEFLLLRFFCLFTKNITIVSKNIRDLYPFEMRSKMEILPNPVISDFSTADVEGKTKARKTILSVGRLNPDKDHEILIRAFGMIAHEFPDWDLKIYGSGSELVHLQSIIFELGLMNRVFMEGTVDNLDKVYTTSQFFVLPSRYESFGLATAEAMSHGLPVIGFADCSGTKEIITHGVDGILVEKRDVSLLSDSIKNLIKNADIRVSYGTESYEKSKLFSLDSVALAWKEYIEKIK